MFVPRYIVEQKLRAMLDEDLGQGDVTTALVVPEGTVAEAEIVCRASGTIAGIEEATILLESLGLKVEAVVDDGESIRPKQVLMKISGDARTILSAERTLLNLLSRMSGIATATRNIIEKIRRAGFKSKVACTRKTAPGLLYFDKKAVQIGGGDPHRLHLDDMVLIKDNHIAVAGSVEKAVNMAKSQASFSKKIEVEVTRVDDALKAARAGADIILLDNLSPSDTAKTVELFKKEDLFGKVLLEVSGGITAENVLSYASSNVDVISLGAITHSVKALDVGLEVTKVDGKSRKK